MDFIILIFVVVATVKSIIIGIILYRVFRQDIHHWWNHERKAKQASPTIPICVYCQSAWTSPVGEAQTRWEAEELVLVTTYECQHCHLPFWHVERVPVTTLKG